MILTICRKEMLEMFRDGRFRWGSTVVLALLLTSVALGWSHYRDVSRQHAQAQEASRRQWLTQGKKNPHSAAHYGVYAFKPRSPLTLIDRGTDAYTGVAVWLEAHRQNDFKYRPAQDANTLHRFGELTAATVLQTLIPLLIVLLSFSAFAGEREQGTLRMLLSLGIPRKQLVAGKMLGIAGALLLLLIPGTLIGAVALAFSSSDGALLLSLPRLLLLTLVYLLYYGIILGISIAVSARAPSAAVALVALFVLWTLNCVVAPRAVSDLARATHSTPSAFQFTNAIERDIRNGIDGHNPQDRRLAAIQARLLQQYKVDSPSQLPINVTGVILDEGEKYGNMVYDRHFSSLWNTFSEQNRMHESFSVLAPMLAVRSLSMGLSATDFHHHRNFAGAAEAYRRMLIKQINDDVTQNSRTGDLVIRGNDLWSKIPDFSYETPDVAWALQNHAISLSILAVWFCFALVIAAISAVRMKVA